MSTPTYADLLKLPDDVHAEIVEGRIVTAPTPSHGHIHVQAGLGRFIGGPFHDDDGRGGPGGWRIFTAPDVAFDPYNICRPDVAGWRRARLADPRHERPITVVPDWVCEVLSPQNAAHDLVTKGHPITSLSERQGGTGHRIHAQRPRDDRAD